MLTTRITRCIIKHIMEYTMVKPLVVPSSFKFSEDAATAQKHAELTEKLERFNTVKAAIADNEQGLAFYCDSWGDDAVKTLLRCTHESRTRLLHCMIMRSTYLHLQPMPTPPKSRQIWRKSLFHLVLLILKMSSSLARCYDECCSPNVVTYLNLV